jgi:Fe/S biogenesis protein NfuA
MSSTVLATPKIILTEEALVHFQGLISKEQVNGMGLRIFVAQPGSAHADVGICFCPPNEQNDTDVPMDFDGFTLYVDSDSIPYLEDANIDYQSEGFSSQLAITAPKLKPEAPTEENSLVEKVEWALTNQINPNLASHGGFVSLVEVTDSNEVILRFGGGCHGCGMADVTLKEGIEVTLKELYSEITAVKDITDHSDGENPYY